uniref:RNA-directed RNA polymerase 2a n=1 Tax=Alfalfa mosaic virus TaxID=12321 RepID=A0A1X9Q218_AMV|nr:RNA-dependent RNA polymerase [Alfalfa mosaic virus]
MFSLLRCLGFGVSEPTGTSSSENVPKNPVEETPNEVTELDSVDPLSRSYERILVSLMLVRKMTQAAEDFHKSFGGELDSPCCRVYRLYRHFVNEDDAPAWAIPNVVNEDSYDEYAYLQEELDAIDSSFELLNEERELSEITDRLNALRYFPVSETEVLPVANVQEVKLISENIPVIDDLYYYSDENVPSELPSPLLDELGKLPEDLGPLNEIEDIRLVAAPITLLSEFKASDNAKPLDIVEIVPDVSLTKPYEAVISGNDWMTLGRMIPTTPIPYHKGKILLKLIFLAWIAGVIQNALDEFLPLHHSIDDKYFQEWVETSDKSLDVDPCRIDLSVFNNWQSSESCYEPRFKTGALSTRKGTQTEALLAIKKRNMNVPNLGQIYDVNSVANSVVNKFLTTVIDPDKLCMFPDFISEGEVSYFQDYIVGKNPDPELYSDPLGVRAIDSYKHMIKSVLKPVEDNSLHLERPMPATITYHDKDIVMSSSPIFLAAAARLMLVLRDKITIPSGKFHQLFSIDAEAFDASFHFKEIDFSKFDKRSLVAFLDPSNASEYLGIPNEFLTLWFNAHRKSRISDSKNGVFFNVDFQRRTGDALTYLGNTIVTLACLCHVYNLMDPNVKFVVASGDDSLIGTVEELPRDQEFLFTTLFNLEAKFPHNQPFICSKSLITMPTLSGSKVVLPVPNPLKLLIRLGSKKVNADIFDEWYQSWIDTIGVFNDHHVIRCVAAMTAHRYLRRPSLYLEAALESLGKIFASKTLCKECLFNEKHESNVKIKPRRVRKSHSDARSRARRA